MKRTTPSFGASSLLVISLTLVVVLLGVVGWRLVGDPDHRCDAGDQPDPELMRRPFTEGSFWNRPVTADVITDDAADSRPTRALRQDTVRSQDGEAEWQLRSWINHREFSMPVVRADGCDPVVTVEEAFPDPDTVSPGPIRIPTDAEPAEGTDRHLLVVQPDGRTVVEMWDAAQRDDSTWTAGRLAVVDLAGDARGPENGVRAYGGSALGGLIRAWEVDPDHPEYVDGVIRHALAVSLPDGLLLYTGGKAGYDEKGYGTAQGYVEPATEQDYDSPWAYYGVIPMGSRVVLPASVDVDSLGLGPEARAIARALQGYGGYVVDRGGADAVSFYAEVAVPDPWLARAVGPDNTGEELERIRKLLVVVG